MSRGDYYPIVVPDILKRAKRDYPDVQYSMVEGKNGGTTPRSNEGPSSVWHDKGGRTYHTSDCVGFALWCLGLDRYQPGVSGRGAFPVYGGWINTDSALEEARTDNRKDPWFTEGPAPSPGGLVVFPGYRRLGVRRPGHVGVVVEVPAEWDSSEKSCWERLVVAHCHGPAMRGPAIDRSHIDAWRNHWNAKGTGTGFLRLTRRAVRWVEARDGTGLFAGDTLGGGK